jgi:tRNA dimethylallyltransferase
MSQKKPVVFIMGPTATGKTKLSIELAQELGFEIVNADSTLVYRGMAIGTAKPTPEEQQGIPHHLLDIRQPCEPYSAGEFCEDALRLIPEIHARGKIPCLVGGTMLYFHYLEKGQLGMPASDPAIRADIEAQSAEIGWLAMWEILKHKNPQRAAELHPNDRQRISRALELAMILERNPHAIKQNQHPLTDLYDLKIICLEAKDRQKLHQRIADRFHQMLADGFLAEAEKLFANPKNNPTLPAMRTVGYRQAKEYLDGNCSLTEFTEKAIIATRQLSKRQHTWLNKWPADCRIDCLSTQLKDWCQNHLTMRNEYE